MKLSDGEKLIWAAACGQMIAEHDAETAALTAYDVVMRVREVKRSGLKEAPAQAMLSGRKT